MRAPSDNDSSQVVMCELTALDMMTNDANYHRVALTRHANNVTLTVDNLTPPHHLTGQSSHLSSA